MAEYPRTETNKPSRHPERASYDVDTVHSILDEGIVAHVGFVVDGRPEVLPMLYVRVGEQLYLHGSTGSHLNRMASRSDSGSVPLVVEVTLFDDLVLSRATFNHSVNYRSVVASGDAVMVRGEEEKRAVLEALVERLVPGRTADARAPRPDELRQTAVLELELADVSAKIRSGDPADDEEDLSRPCWAGLLPLEARWGEPRASSDLAAGTELPSYLEEMTRAPFAG